MRYRALLAAIDDYGSVRNNLPSCVNDLNYVRGLLVDSLALPAGKTKKLVNGEVTVEALQAGLAWLTEDVADDERLLFFYSGHGFQVPATDGSGSVEEALVLSQNRFFFDNALVERSKAARPSTLTVLLDCCFGGGNDKSFVPTGDFGTLVTPKRWSPPDDFLEKSVVLATAESVPVRSYRPFGSRPVASKALPSVVLSTSGLTPWPSAIDEAGSLRSTASCWRPVWRTRPRVPAPLKRKGCRRSPSL